MTNNTVRKNSTEISFHNFGFTLIRTRLGRNLASSDERTRLGRNLVNVHGFTLIELLVVMAIIAVLAGMSLFALQGSRESSRDARRKADLETIRSGVELYRADCGNYPASITTGAQLNGDDSSVGCAVANVYIQNVPDDPVSGWDYAYTRLTTTTYEICTTLESDTTSTPSCTGSCGATCRYKVNNP